MTSFAEKRVSDDPNQSVELANEPCITLRAAREADRDEIASLANAAGGDTINFIFGGLHPVPDAIRIYRSMILEHDGIFSLRNCIVAVASEQVVGIANAFPAIMIKGEIADGRMTEREEFLRPRTELNDWSSYFLNNISVSTQFRRRGVGSMLLTAVVEEARSRNFPSVTLHVWADNANARAVYRKAGFRQDGWAQIPWHVDLPHEGGSLLLKLRLRKMHRPTQQRKRG